MTTKFDSFVSRFVKLDLEKMELTKQAYSFFIDKNETLEDRWKLFSLLTPYLPDEDMTDGYLDILDMTPYDDFYIERHQTKHFIDIAQELELGEWVTQEDLDEKGITPEKVAAWKEAVLADGCGSFTYDW